jgi:TIR domain-containing protein
VGGQDWEATIRRAIRESSHFLALISQTSVDKRGFVQKELRQALEVLDEFPPGEIFVVPVRLDNSKPRHDRLAGIHWIDLFPDYVEGLQRIARSLNIRPHRSPTSVLEPTAASPPKATIAYLSVHTHYRIHDIHGHRASARNIQIVRATGPGIDTLVTRGISGTGRTINVRSNLGATRVVSEGGVLTAYTKLATPLPPDEPIEHLLSYTAIDCYPESNEAVAQNISRPLEHTGVHVHLPPKRPFLSASGHLVAQGGVELDRPLSMSPDSLEASLIVPEPPVGSRLILRWQW